MKLKLINSQWESVFAQSKANGAGYVEPEIIHYTPVERPRGTWFQKRRAKLAQEQAQEDEK